MDNAKLLQEVTAKAQVWLGKQYDAQTRAEVQRMLDNEDKTELIECFYKDLEFGTGGLRGIMGAGSNRMNIYTVGAATQGLANYLKKSFADRDKISVVIGHDCRNNSRKFAEVSADILTANGIYVYLFDSLRPTPEISFAIRHLGCQSGIILTASHNPKEYNGYKAYWEDGGQMIAPHDHNTIKEVNAIKSIDDVKFQGRPELITSIGEDIDKVYIEKILGVSMSPEAIAHQKNLKIVYTPIHGTGIKVIPKCLKALGFENLISVPEQEVISGDFPTVVSPNPEEPAALSMAIAKAKEVDADIVMASDPDSDRLGIAIKDDRGEWILVSGNQNALLISNYLLKQWKAKGRLNGNQYMVKTIVTTELLKDIAQKNGVEIYDVYTGFKWIAGVMLQMEGKKEFICGGEESYGFLVEDFVRDKDAVSAAAMIAEVLADAKDHGKTLYEQLLDIYLEFGYSKEKSISIVRKGKSGAEEIQAMMDNYRAHPVKELAGSPVVLVKDFKKMKACKPATGETYDLVMPEPSNVLQYFCADGTKVSVRPSGTEPKIKFYMEVRSQMATRADYRAACQAAEARIEEIKKSLGI